MDQHKPTLAYSPEYDGGLSSFNGYTMAAAAVPPVPIPPLTPLSAHPELPINAECFDQVRRKSLPYASDSSASSSSYTSPPGGYSDHSPTTSNATLSTAPPTSSRRASTDGHNYDLYSPLNGLPESESVVIPPLLPPSVQWPDNDFDDWDALPDLLRQDRKADYTPRRPMNIYFIYMRVRRPELAFHNPNLSTGDLSKLLGKEWNSMTPDQKAPWNELAERLMRAFKKKFPDYQYERGGGKKLKKRPRSLVLTAPNTMLSARRASQPYQMRVVTDPQSPVWDPVQGGYVYKEYAQYQPPQTAPASMYAHPIPTPMQTPGGGHPMSSPVYPSPGWPTHSLEPHHGGYAPHLEQPQPMAAYPFPTYAAPPPPPEVQQGAYQYAVPHMYTPPAEAQSPWDEYMVQ